MFCGDNGEGRSGVKKKYYHAFEGFIGHAPCWWNGNDTSYCHRLVGFASQLGLKGLR